jgi:uncharacterized lipoprotein YajG
VIRSLLALLSLSILLTGCRAHVIEVEIVNHTDQPIRNVEVTFGGGTYGKSSIPAQSTNHNRIKIFSLAPIQVQFDDATGKHITTDGPKLAKNSEGTLTLTINASGEKWSGQAAPR